MTPISRKTAVKKASAKSSTKKRKKSKPEVKKVPTSQNKKNQSIKANTLPQGKTSKKNINKGEELTPIKNLKDKSEPLRPERVELTPTEGVIVYTSLLVLLLFMVIFTFIAYKSNVVAHSDSSVDLFLPVLIFLLSITHFIGRLVESLKLYKKSKYLRYQEENEKFPMGC